jgi:hypothetical protein
MSTSGSVVLLIGVSEEQIWLYNWIQCQKSIPIFDTAELTSYLSLYKSKLK